MSNPNKNSEKSFSWMFKQHVIMLHHINKLFIKHFLNTYLLGVVFNNGTKAMVVKWGAICSQGTFDNV